ncbi:DedA family protein [Pediococcus acidilactici]|uniref:DedA family protein n=1 Tax=Pediococcus acidilactici TaxID=1254 RepID=UPI001CCAA2C4|nr:alkaline phosphatase [Pediococcus acidilactici]
MLNLIWGFLVHPLSYLTPLTTQLNQWVYLILFIWIFLETVFIFFSFLPGQSVLFLTGTIASTAPAHLNIFLLLLTFIAAATTGAMVKYWYGVNLESKNKIAQKISDSPQLDQTQKLFDKNTKNRWSFLGSSPSWDCSFPLLRERPRWIGAVSISSTLLACYCGY